VWAHIQKRRKYNRIWEQRYRFEQVQSLTKKKTYSRKKKLLERIHVTLSISMSTNGKTSHKSIANVARTIAMSITNFLKGLMLLCKIRLWKRSWDSTLWVLLCHCICVILKG
jgi:hypothetical protein